MLLRENCLVVAYLLGTGDFFVLLQRPPQEGDGVVSLQCVGVACELGSSGGVSPLGPAEPPVNKFWSYIQLQQIGFLGGCQAFPGVSISRRATGLRGLSGHHWTETDHCTEWPSLD